MDLALAVDNILWMGSARGHTKVVEDALNKGWDVNGVGWYLKDDMDGILRVSPLIIASLNGHVDIVTLLLRRGADVSQVDLLKRTALHQAVLSGFSRCVEQLLLHGADVNAEDNQGLSVLFLAVARGKVEIIRQLLQNKANVMALDSRGYKLRDYVDGNEEVGKVLDEEETKLDKMLAFSMSHHPRLGAGSMAHSFDPEVLKMILMLV